MLAILLPCLTVPLFAAFYFPNQLDRSAHESLILKGRSVVQLAASQAGPVAQLIEDGFGVEAVELDPLLEAVIDAGASYAGVVSADGETVLRSINELPPAVFGRPPDACEINELAHLQVRCPLGGARGAFVAGFSTLPLQLAERTHRFAGLLSLLAALGIGGVMAFFFSRALLEPLMRLTTAAQEVAAGDVTVESVDSTLGGEMGLMAESFNEMLGSLRGLVTQVVSLTERLAGASKGLIDASSDQEKVTQQQSAYGQEIAATFEELSRAAEQISRSTRIVENAAQNTNETVEQARAVVNEVAQHIGHIRGESDSVAQVIDELNRELKQVSKIARVINEVAERSDLLALNASLEGTKAGEVGRGFSLVAAEMRKLAETIAVSARDIGRIVTTLQESGSRAISQARRSVEASDQGVAVAERASTMFERIVELARGTATAAQEISAATTQQQVSSEQAVAGARNTATLIAKGVDATGRTTQIAQDLQNVAWALSELTSRFKVGTLLDDEAARRLPGASDVPPTEKPATGGANTRDDAA